MNQLEQTIVELHNDKVKLTKENNLLRINCDGLKQLLAQHLDENEKLTKELKELKSKTPPK